MVYSSGIGRIWEAAGRVAIYGLYRSEYVVVMVTPTLFVEERDDLIRFDIDYGTLCEIMIKSEYLMLHGDDLLD